MFPQTTMMNSWDRSQRGGGCNANLLFAVLVHRTNRDITSDPTTISPGTTCKSIRDSTHSKTAARREKIVL